MTAAVRVATSNEDLAQVQRVFAGTFAAGPHPADLRGSLLAGGCCLLAEEDGAPVGALWAFAAVDAEGVHQHSHSLAITPARRGRGHGERLKRAHAAWCLERGVARVRWTFDPLMAGNARFNLERLGAVGEGWVEDCYGGMTGPLDPVARTGAEAPADRLYVTWYLDGAPPPPDGGEVLVPLPDTGSGAGTAAEGVRALREALAPRLEAGARVVGVVAQGDGHAYRVALPEGVA